VSSVGPESQWQAGLKFLTDYLRYSYKLRQKNLEFFSFCVLTASPIPSIFSAPSQSDPGNAVAKKAAKLTRKNKF